MLGKKEKTFQYDEIKHVFFFLKKDLGLIEIGGGKDSLGEIYVLSGYGEGEKREEILKKLEEFKLMGNDK